MHPTYTQTTHLLLRQNIVPTMESEKYPVVLLHFHTLKLLGMKLPIPVPPLPVLRLLLFAMF